MMRAVKAAAVAGLCAVLAGPAPARDRSPFGRDVRGSLGVNIHFTDPQPGEMDMLADSGMRWVRMDLAWGATERQKGVYDFSHYDTLMDNLRRKGMKALLILDYGNDIYGSGGKPPYDDEGRAAFARWAVAAVQRYQGKGVLWELWNEPNGAWFWPSPSADDYSKLALTVDMAIHDRFPKERLIGPATSGIDLGFLEGCFKAGCLQYWDAVSVHPYRQNEPESAAPEYAKLRDLIAKYAPPGKKIPILAAEWGYSVSWGNYTEERQGNYLAREFLTNIENGIPLTIWYDWHDDGPNPKDAENNFGMVRSETHPGRKPIYDPKPAYTACQTLTAILDGFDFDSAVTPGREDASARLTVTPGDGRRDHVLKFRRGDNRRFAAWTESETPHVTIIPMRRGDYTVVDWLGKTFRHMRADRLGLSLEIGDHPQYIIPGTQDRL
jgi:hypothetical protein